MHRERNIWRGLDPGVEKWYPVCTLMDNSLVQFFYYNTNHCVGLNAGYLLGVSVYI